MRALVAIIVLLALTACQPRQERIATGKIVPTYDLPGFKGDQIYGQINSAWLADFHARWKSDLFDKGVVRWEQRFDCNRFAAHFAASAQIEYFTQNFHSWTTGQAAAVGEVWYLVGAQPGRAHAIVLAYTERGPVYFEPQTGAQITLSAAEKASVYYARF